MRIFYNFYYYNSQCSYIAEAMCHQHQWLSYNQWLALYKELCYVGHICGSWYLFVRIVLSMLADAAQVFHPNLSMAEGEEFASTTVCFQ